MDFAVLIPLWIIAGLMAVFTAWLVKKSSEIKSLIDAGIMLFLLSMMAEMFISTVVYLYVPAPATVFELVVINMAAMSFTIIAILLAIFGGNKTLDQAQAGIVGVRSLIIASIIALVILSEVFMGWTFALLGGAASSAGGLQGIFAAITNSSSSYWFIFTMSAEMAITLFFIRNKLPKGFSWLLASQTIIMILSPTAIHNSLWADLSFVAGTAVMTFLFIYIFKFLYKNRTLSKGILNYLLLLMLAYALMMTGQFIWLLTSDAAVFVLSIIIEMIVYFGIILDERRLVSSKSETWQSMPYWVFAFLGLLFVAEFFMGGVLDIQVYGSSFFNGIISASTIWPLSRILSAAGYVGSMAVFTAWLMKKGSEIKSLIDAGIVLFLLSMMATMFISTVVYIYLQASITILELIAINMAVASVTAVATLFAVDMGNESLVKN
ncbi:MAG TPA: hypothetical protein VK487_10605, partial [Candidatus Bathyarchaeia archaeon]|nr:hypothetical protein [Candidatus Bathyarchaeia archaeon]